AAIVASSGPLYSLPNTKSTTQHPRTCPPPSRQWPKISASVQPASSRASARSRGRGGGGPDVRGWEAVDGRIPVTVLISVRIRGAVIAGPPWHAVRQTEATQCPANFSFTTRATTIIGNRPKTGSTTGKLHCFLAPPRKNSLRG